MSIEYNSKFFSEIFKSISDEYDLAFTKKYFLSVCQKVCKSFESESEKDEKEVSGCQWTLTRGKVGQLCGVKTKDSAEFCARHQKCKKDVKAKPAKTEGCQHINERGANKGNACAKKCAENSSYCKVHESKHASDSEDVAFETENEEKKTTGKKTTDKNKNKKTTSKKSSSEVEIEDEEEKKEKPKTKKTKAKKQAEPEPEPETEEVEIVEEEKEKPKKTKTKKSKAAKEEAEEETKEEKTKRSDVFDFKTSDPVAINDQANKSFWKNFPYSSKDLPKNLVFNSKTSLLLIKAEDHYTLYGVLVKGSIIKKLENGEVDEDVINWCAKSNILI